jgi:hypothetical protein
MLLHIGRDATHAQRLTPSSRHAPVIITHSILYVRSSTPLILHFFFLGMKKSTKSLSASTQLRATGIAPTRASPKLGSGGLDCNFLQSG